MQNMRGIGILTVLMMFGIVIINLSSLSRAQAGEFRFGLATSLSERYDDNIFLSEKGREEDDFITSITLSPSLTYKTPTTDFTLQYNPAFEFYAENSDENDVRHNGSLNLVSKLTPQLTFLATDTLAFIPGQDIAREERFIEDYTGSRGTASDLLRNAFNSTLAYQASKTTSIRGGFGYSFNRYDRPEETDDDTYKLTLGMDHQLTGSDVVFGEYSYRMIRYDHPSWYPLENDTNIHSITIGNTHTFPRDMVLKVSGGILFIDEDNAQSETGWNAGISLRKNFSTGSVEASFNRDVSPGEGEGSVTINNILRVSASRQFTRLWSGTFSTFYSNEKSVSHDEEEWEDMGFTAGASYEFSRQLTGNLSGSYVRQNAKGISGGDTDQYHARIGVNYLLRPHWSIFGSYGYYRQNGLDAGISDIEDNLFEVGTRITWF
jgi:opacity protein-like surface antigen